MSPLTSMCEEYSQRNTCNAMRVLIDTCEFIDYVCGRAPFDVAANSVISLGVDGQIELLILPVSFATCVYIGKQTKSSNEHILKCFSNILPKITLAKTSKATMRQAIDSQWKDFEDAMQYYTALAHHADAIITRNKKDFKQADIPVYTPKEFINELVEIID